MIVTEEATLARNLASGVWGEATLCSILHDAARAHPERLALVDDPERAAWNGTAPSALSWRELDARVTKLASFFAMAGLRPDTVVGLQLPNAVESVVVFLAVLRAGLIAAPIPLHWDRSTMLASLPRIAPKILITTGRIDDVAVGVAMRDVAAAMFGVRFLFGVGAGLPDGALDLGSILGSSEFHEAPPPKRDGNRADHVATVTFGARGPSGEPPLHVRSHNHWVATGLMTQLETRMAEGASLLSPFALTGIAGIGAGLMPWLLAAGTLHLHHFRSLRDLVSHSMMVGPDVLLLPAVLAAPFVRVATGPEGLPARTVAAVWKDDHFAAPGDPRGETEGAVLIDVTVLDEFGAVARQRPEGAATPVALPTGPIGAPSDGFGASALIEARIDGAEDAILSLRGPAIPETAALRFDETAISETGPEGFATTRVAVLVDEDGTAFHPAGRRTISAAPAAPLAADEPLERLRA